MGTKELSLYNCWSYRYENRGRRKGLKETRIPVRDSGEKLALAGGNKILETSGLTSVASRHLTESMAR